MGKLQELKDKAKDMVTDNKDKIATGVDKAGDFIDQKTGHKHSDKIDDAQRTVEGKLDKVTGGDISENEKPIPSPSPPSAATSVPEAGSAAVSPSVTPNSSPDATAEGTRTNPTPRAH